MENPMLEIRDVVRSLTEPKDSITICANIDKYFTEDAFICHPLINQPESLRGRENLKAIYKFFRIGTLNNKIIFHAVMFNEDLTECTLELTEEVQGRTLPPGLRSLQKIRFLVRVTLRLDADGKYRISRQHDNFVSDLRMSGIGAFCPGVSLVSDLIKGAAGFWTIITGSFLLARGYGP